MFHLRAMSMRKYKVATLYLYRRINFPSLRNVQISRSFLPCTLRTFACQVDSTRSLYRQTSPKYANICTLIISSCKYFYVVRQGFDDTSLGFNRRLSSSIYLASKILRSRFVYFVFNASRVKRIHRLKNSSAQNTSPEQLRSEHDARTKTVTKSVMELTTRWKLQARLRRGRISSSWCVIDEISAATSRLCATGRSQLMLLFWITYSQCGATFASKLLQRRRGSPYLAFQVGCVNADMWPRRSQRLLITHRFFFFPARKIIREKSRRHGKVRCGRATFFLQPSVSKWEYTVATEAIDPLLYFSQHLYQCD